MRARLIFQQGLITSDNDWTGIARLLSLENSQRFFTVDSTEKTYYPSSSAEY